MLFDDMIPTSIFGWDTVLVVGVADEIMSKGHSAAFAEASSESRVAVIDSRVNNGDLDTLSGVLERLLDIIHTSHLMSRHQLGIGGVLLRDGRFGEKVAFDGPNALDTRDLGQIFASVARLDLDRGTVELAVLATHLERKVLSAV